MSSADKKATVQSDWQTAIFISPAGNKILLTRHWADTMRTFEKELIKPNCEKPNSQLKKREREIVRENSPPHLPNCD